ncbi:MAG: ferrous iron transporter B [Bacillota bacterium]
MAVPPAAATYRDSIEQAIHGISNLLHANYRLSRRSIALLLLQGDAEIEEMVKEREGKRFDQIKELLLMTRVSLDIAPSYAINLDRQRHAERLLSGTITQAEARKNTFSARLDGITTNLVTGIPILLAVLYFGLYKFVGEFGAGTVVDFLEERVFETYINPSVDAWVASNIPWTPLQELLAMEYGIITLGVRYAIAIVLPIVGTFFLAFSVIEDTGYLPRLALLVDRVFKAIGLNGRAVIPMTLGFGCDTMATLVTRTLETRRERIISTFLLALAIPCSAQLGVILAIMAGQPQALLVWVGFMLVVFLLIGYLTAKVMPGDRPSFYIELPPLRLPRLANILTKTYTRMQWYLLEVLPLFVFASILIWVGRLTGVFGAIIDMLGPVMHALGLPESAGEAFLFGFFRRDYGAAGLYDLEKVGLLSPRQLVVASATLTLFVPCIAQFVLMVKERGIKTAMAIFAFIFPFAFSAGYVLNALLRTVGW